MSSRVFTFLDGQVVLKLFIKPGSLAVVAGFPLIIWTTIVLDTAYVCYFGGLFLFEVQLALS